MIEEKISRKLAVLAKEIGFGGKGMTSDWSYIDGVDRVVMLPSNNKSPLASKNTFSAPTKSLYQRYLRENWKVNVVPMTNSSGWFWKAQRLDGGFFTNSDYTKGPGVWDTYEDAFEAGLISVTEYILKNTEEAHV